MKISVHRIDCNIVNIFDCFIIDWSDLHLICLVACANTMTTLQVVLALKQRAQLLTPAPIFPCNKSEEILLICCAPQTLHALSGGRALAVFWHCSGIRGLLLSRSLSNAELNLNCISLFAFDDWSIIYWCKSRFCAKTLYTIIIHLM